MVIAALIADGKTEISNINYIDRGYEKLEEKLAAIEKEFGCLAIVHEELWEKVHDRNTLSERFVSVSGELERAMTEVTRLGQLASGWLEDARVASRANAVLGGHPRAVRVVVQLPWTGGALGFLGHLLRDLHRGIALAEKNAPKLQKQRL